MILLFYFITPMVFVRNTFVKKLEWLDIEFNKVDKTKVQNNWS